MTFQPRDYQTAAVQSIYDYFSEGKGEAPLICAPTGSGKSLVIAMLMKRAVEDYPQTRILLATHVKELIAQDYKELLRLWPEAPAGIYSAGLGRRQAHSQLLFAGVQSIYKKTRQIGHVDLMLVDEAHLVGRNTNSQYGKLISGLSEINPQMKVIGLSATPYRLDSGLLHEGYGAIFDGIAYDIPIAMLVERGYLCPLISKRPGTTFDLSGLHRRMGDYIESEMAGRFAQEAVTREAVKEMVTLGQDRKAWLAFCINVDHATQVRDEIRSYGISCETVTGNTPAPERDRLIRDFKAGRIRCLSSVNVISTGFDAPHTDMLALMRPTQSTGLYLQQVGRGLRIHPSKANCLVLDYAQNVVTHGPVDAIELPGKKARDPNAEKGEVPAKTCPECQSILFIAAMECPDCGYIFPPPEPKIDERASTAAIMNMTAEDDWRQVTDFAMSLHDPRDGRPVSMRAEYLVDGRAIAEWVCFEHVGFARQKAVQWWHANAGTTPPNTVAEALERAREIRVPAEAVVRKEGKYWRVVRARGESKRSAA